MLGYKIPFSKTYFLNLFWSSGRERPERIERGALTKKLKYRRLTVEPGLLWSDSKVYCLLLGLSRIEGKEEVEIPAGRFLRWLGRGCSGSSYNSLLTSLSLLKRATLEIPKFQDGKETITKLKLIEDFKYSFGTLRVKLSSGALEEFLVNKGKGYEIPLIHLLSERAKGMAYSLLTVSYYFYFSRKKWINLGEDPWEFGKKWLGVYTRKGSFITKLERAVERVNGIIGLPFSLRLYKDKGKPVLKIDF